MPDDGILLDHFIAPLHTVFLMLDKFINIDCMNILISIYSMRIIFLEELWTQDGWMKLFRVLRVFIEGDQDDHIRTEIVKRVSFAKI